jgi:hypothetical protein
VSVAIRSTAFDLVTHPSRVLGDPPGDHGDVAIPFAAFDLVTTDFHMMVIPDVAASQFPSRPLTS